jgi:hypothetical protein
MKYLVLAIFVVFFVSTSHADQQVLRRPAAVDYAAFLKDADTKCNECEFLLTSSGDKAQAGVSGLIYVRTQAVKGKDDRSEIQAAYFRLQNGNDREPFSLSAYGAYGIATDRLKNVQASDFYTGEMLRSIATSPTLAPGATFVVSHAAPADASILIRHSSSTNFVVEQASDSARFSANMKRMREREFSQKVTVFDFTPSSRFATRSMGVNGPAFVWKVFSSHVSSVFETYGKPEVIGQRTKAALLRRLQDPTGGVIVLYAHSDGKDIILDTDEGVVHLTPEDIVQAGRTAPAGLAPIILLNCETRAVLGPQFLSAGSPFVATTDQKLGLFEVGSFISQFARAMYVGGLDTIDAYFVAQQFANPNRLRPIADNESRGHGSVERPISPTTVR